MVRAPVAIITLVESYINSEIFTGFQLLQPVRALKNTPTCYRAPRWPDPEFPRKIPKKYSPGRNSGTPRKYPKIPKKYLKYAFWVFSWYFFRILVRKKSSCAFKILVRNSGAGNGCANFICVLSAGKPPCPLYPHFGGGGDFGFGGGGGSAHFIFMGAGIF